MRRSTRRLIIAHNDQQQEQTTQNIDEQDRGANQYVQKKNGLKEGGHDIDFTQPSTKKVRLNDSSEMPVLSTKETFKSPLFSQQTTSESKRRCKKTTEMNETDTSSFASKSSITIGTVLHELDQQQDIEEPVAVTHRHAASNSKTIWETEENDRPNGDSAKARRQPMSSVVNDEDRNEWNRRPTHRIHSRPTTSTDNNVDQSNTNDFSDLQQPDTPHPHPSRIMPSVTRRRTFDKQSPTVVSQGYNNKNNNSRDGSPRFSNVSINNHPSSIATTNSSRNLAILRSFPEYRSLLREHAVLTKRCEQWSRDYEKQCEQYRQLVATTFPRPSGPALQSLVDLVDRIRTPTGSIDTRSDEQLATDLGVSRLALIGFENSDPQKCALSVFNHLYSSYESRAELENFKIFAENNAQLLEDILVFAKRSAPGVPYDLSKLKKALGSSIRQAKFRLRESQLNLTPYENFVNHDETRNDREIEDDFDGINEQDEENRDELDRNRYLE